LSPLVVIFHLLLIHKKYVMIGMKFIHKDSLLRKC
jgi:hypothetical protein